jgi:hypothetical protein
MEGHLFFQYLVREQIIRSIRINIHFRIASMNMVSIQISQENIT